MEGSAIIIGGGIGGLFTGALLARNGWKVTVLEKNAIIGGGLQCFHRKGKIYETGMHVMGGFEPGGNLARICNYLGILDKLDIQHIDAECMDMISYRRSGEVYRIPSGREAFVKAMSERFPNEAAGIAAYVDAIYRLTEEVPLFYLHEEPEGFAVHSEQFTWAADRLIAHYVSDGRLREVLAYLNPLYGGIAGHTPAYIHALINVLYINGASRFRGGSQQLADALRDVITAAGGEVLAGCEATHVEVTDRKVRYVETADGVRRTADRYVSAIHPVALLDILSEHAFLRGYVNRLKEIPVSYSAFSLYIDLKPGQIPYVPHTCYYMEDYGHIWNQHEARGEDWPQGFMYMTPPDREQGEYATRMLVHCIMSYDEVRRWADTRVGHRGADYEAWKREHVDRIVRKLDNIYPGFAGRTEAIYAASPLTVRDYFNTKEGAIFGYRKDCGNMMLTQLPVYTKVCNLLLTGQNINLHGICGVPLTAINTAEAILGRNVLIKKINDAYDNR